MANNKFKTGLIISIVLHLGLFLSISLDQPSKRQQKRERGQKGKGKKSLQAKIQLPAQYGGQGEECKNGYVGIGVVVNFLREITQVAPGSPASRAGLRAGDELVTSINNAELQEEQVIQVEFRRGAQVFNKKIKVEKICK